MSNLFLLLILSSCTSFVPVLPVFYEGMEMALGVFEKVGEEIIEEEVEDAMH